MWSSQRLASETAFLQKLERRADSCYWTQTLFRLLEIGAPLPAALRLVHEQLRADLIEVAKVCTDLGFLVPPALTEDTVTGAAVLRASEDYEMVRPTYLQALTMPESGRVRA